MNKSSFTLIVATLCFGMGACPSHGQYRLLQPGQSVTHHFDFLPHQGPFGDTVPTPAQGRFSFYAFQSTEPDAALRLELFENSTAETPLFVGTWNPTSGLDVPALADAWQDRQGVVRFTGLRGTTGYASFQVAVLTPVDLFRYDVYSRTFPAAPAPVTPQVFVDFDRYASPSDNDLANHFISYYGLSQVPTGGVTGGAAAGSLAEITTYGFAVLRSHGLRNLPGDNCEVSALFKIVPATFRPSSGASFKLVLGCSTNAAALVDSEPIAARFFGPGDTFAMPSGYNWGSVTSTNWFRLTLNVLNEGQSNRFALSVSLQDHGPTGLAPTGPLLSSVWEVSINPLAKSPVLFPGFYVDGVRFGQTLVDNFGFNGINYEPPELTAISSEGALRLSWRFAGTHFLLESTSSLQSPASWAPVLEPVADDGDRHSIAISFDRANRFFRLRYQVP
ncbi:MAG TPA: hypothetical protein VNU68_11360 [Verrucomicrobiae bacterium]|nr:hypothetical protein [Verrucomicrobiae bacterium]